MLEINQNSEQIGKNGLKTFLNWPKFAKISRFLGKKRTKFASKNPRKIPNFRGWKIREIPRIFVVEEIRVANPSGEQKLQEYLAASEAKVRSYYQCFSQNNPVLNLVIKVIWRLKGVDWLQRRPPNPSIQCQCAQFSQSGDEYWNLVQWILAKIPEVMRISKGCTLTWGAL